MKDLKKLKQLTNNPLTLLFGLNHNYLNRNFTMFVRIIISSLILMGVAIGFSVGSYDVIFLLLIVLGLYYLIDKLRIEKHLINYNIKFEQALELIRNKQIFKGFKKLIKFGLKDSVIWIMDNKPEILTGSLLETVDKNQFMKITKQIENRDVEGVIYSLKKVFLNYNLI